MTKNGNPQLKRPSQVIIAKMTDVLNSKRPENCLGFVALQLGASEEKRRWPVDFFAEVGSYLWRRFSLCPVLLGGKAEEGLAHSYKESATEPFLSLLGKTTIPELAAVLLSSNLLITNDTGTMHLAAGYNIPILAFFLATAQPFDTGPYLPNSCSLEPNLACHPCAFQSRCEHDFVCRRTILPSFVIKQLDAFFSTGRWGKIPSSSTRAWVSQFDESGFMGLCSLSSHENDPRTVWLRLLRYAMRQFLDSSVKKKNFEKITTDFPLFQIGDGNLENSLNSLLNLVLLFQEQGKVLQVYPSALLKEKFMQTWERIFLLMNEHVYLAALSILWVEGTQKKEQELVEALNYAQSFHSLLVFIASCVHKQ